MAKILVIDDDKVFALLLRNFLTAKGHGVAVGLDSSSAERLALAEKPDMAIIDYQMPGKSGTQLLADLRKREETRRLPVIFLSAMDTLLYSAQVPPEPRVRFLQKPVTMDTLLAMIEELLDPDGWSA